MARKSQSWAAASLFMVAFVLAGIMSGVLVSIANQSNTWSPLIGPVSGIQLTTNYNNAFSAIQSCNSGAAAPTNDQSGGPVQGQCWLNTSTTPFTVQQYDGASWLTVGWLDTVNHQWIINTAGGVGTVASATITDLCQTSGVLSPNPAITITGSVTINGFGSSCPLGTIKLVNFTGTPTLVNNATSFILPNAGFNISVGVGDTLVATAIGAGNWRVVSYQQATGLGGIPSGTEAPFAGISAPSGWTLEAGQAISRTGSVNLFNAITMTTTGTPANGSPNINSVGVDLRNLGVEGAFLEGTGIPVGAFVSSVTASTITMSTNATGGNSGEVIRILPWGQGDAVTTFNLPDRRGVVLAGRDNMNGTAANRLTLAQSQGILGTKLGNGSTGGNIGGEQSHTQLLAEIASHTHTINISDPGHTHTVGVSNSGVDPQTATAGSLTRQSGTTTSASATTGLTSSNVTAANSGSGTAMNQIQPTAITNYIIKN